MSDFLWGNLKAQTRRAVGLTTPYAIVGDEAGNIYHPYLPGNVWVRQIYANGYGKAFPVIGPAGTSLKLDPGTAVKLFQNSEGCLQIQNYNVAASIIAGTNIFSANDATLNSGSFVGQQSIITALVVPQAIPNLTVMIKAWLVVVLGIYYEFPGLASLDLSTYVPSSGNNRYAVVFLDSDYATTRVTASTARLTTDLPLAAADIQECLSAAPTTSTPLATIKLYGGQTTIQNADIVHDLRQFLNTSAAIAGDATPSTTGVVLIEQSPPSGHPRAITIGERNTPNGLSPTDTDGMRSSLEIPTGLQTNAAIPETSKWVRYSGNPLFGGANANAVNEPSVFPESNKLVMYYRKGWTTTQLNRATSSDGLSWTDYGSNPVLGSGGSGFAGNVFEPFVVKFDGVYHCYFNDAIPHGNFSHSTSTDGITWTTPTILIANGAYAWADSWGNPYVWQEGYTWYMLMEYLQPAGGNWQTALFKGTDGLTWTLVTQPLTSLQPAAGGDVGGPSMAYGVQKRNGLYHLWYHGNTVTSGLPTDLYHATSPDLTNWTITNSGNPILTHTGSAPEEDQVADPTVVEFNNKTFLYFNGVNNATNTAKMEVLTYNGLLSELVDGSGLTRLDVKEGSTPTPNPPTNVQSLFLDSTSHHLKRVNSSGTVVDIESPTDTDYYQTVQVDGSVMTQRSAADFISGQAMAITGTDDSGGDRTKLTFNAGIFAPLVTGDLPGPVAIATGDGEFIMVQIA